MVPRDNDRPEKTHEQLEQKSNRWNPVKAKKIPKFPIFQRR